MDGMAVTGGSCCDDDDDDDEVVMGYRYRVKG